MNIELTLNQQKEIIIYVENITKENWESIVTEAVQRFEKSKNTDISDTYVDQLIDIVMDDDNAFIKYGSIHVKEFPNENIIYKILVNRTIEFIRKHKDEELTPDLIWHNIHTSDEPKYISFL